MLVVDGLNGLWGLRLLNHTDRFALLAPQVMGLVWSPPLSTAAFLPRFCSMSASERRRAKTRSFFRSSLALRLDHGR
jgi:hypothetical protein